MKIREWKQTEQRKNEILKKSTNQKRGKKKKTSKSNRMQKIDLNPNISVTTLNEVD